MFTVRVMGLRESRRWKSILENLIRSRVMEAESGGEEYRILENDSSSRYEGESTSVSDLESASLGDASYLALGSGICLSLEAESTSKWRTELESCGSGIKIRPRRNQNPTEDDSKSLRVGINIGARRNQNQDGIHRILNQHRGRVGFKIGANMGYGFGEIF